MGTQPGCTVRAGQRAAGSPQQHVLTNPPPGCQHGRQGLTVGQAVPFVAQIEKDRSEVSEDRRSHKQVQDTGKPPFAGPLRSVSQPPKAEAKAKAAERFFSDGILSAGSQPGCPDAPPPPLEAAPNLRLAPGTGTGTPSCSDISSLCCCAAARPTGQHGALTDLYAQRPKHFLQSPPPPPPRCSSLKLLPYGKYLESSRHSSSQEQVKYWP